MQACMLHVDPGHYLDIVVVGVEGDSEQGEGRGGLQQALGHRHDALLCQGHVEGERHHIHREVGKGEAGPRAVARHFTEQFLQDPRPGRHQLHVAVEEAVGAGHSAWLHSDLKISHFVKQI